MDERLSRIKKPSETIDLESTQIDDEVDSGLNKEIEKKLKLRGHPIRLFGETDRQRMSRLKLLEVREEELSGGQRNDFNELYEGTGTQKDSDDPSAKLELFKSIEEIEKIDRVLLIKDRTKTRNLLDIFLKTLLQEWQSDLDTRLEEVKKSTAGRMTSATFHQTREYLTPFFRLLKKNELPNDILSHVVDIVGFIQDREYVRANDTYLRLSIGNAPWPIGVTMVGIHERSAHEKINTGTVAHALNDEVTRKWIQSIKRLMTFCQKLHPPTDSSKAMG